MAKGKVGGFRPGAGRPKGSKNKETIAKEEAREAHRKIVMRHMEQMTAAQIANAKGLNFLVSRSKTSGKFTRLSKEPKPGDVIGDKDEIIEVWFKDPSTQAYTDLMNRALDKAKEQPQTVEVTGLEQVAERLARGRERAARGEVVTFPREVEKPDRETG